MGTQDVTTEADDRTMRQFTRAVLDDLRGLQVVVLTPDAQVQVRLNAPGGEQELEVQAISQKTESSC